PETLPRARVKKSYVSWLVWIMPLAAAIFAAALFYREFADNARTVTVAFKNVDGVDDQGNTMVRCRGANVGVVKGVALSPDQEWAKLKMMFRKDQENLAREGTLFWVVRPQVSAGALRGLETVMSGAYVQLRPGDGPRTNYFVGADEPPPVELPSKALEI